jgi:hypothetical protein
MSMKTFLPRSPSMTDPATIQPALAAQLGAALDTLGYCIEQCPEDQWQESHGDYPFSQVVFHTLFFCDYYLSGSMGDFRSQDYHAAQLGLRLQLLNGSEMPWFSKGIIQETSI